MTNDSKNHPQRLIGRSEVANRLGVSPQTVDKLVQRGALPPPVVHSGRIVRFDQGAVDKALGGNHE